MTARSNDRSNDRVSRCTFTFADGRRCRTPRFVNHLHFCHYHARKEAQALAAENLGQDVSCFFSGRYLSACDLAAALGRLFAAVASGNVKPRTASTLAYLAQTLLQTIHLAEHEYSEACGGNAWRQRIYDSINRNADYRAAGAGERSPSPPQPPSPTSPPPSQAPPVPSNR